MRFVLRVQMTADAWTEVHVGRSALVEIGASARLLQMEVPPVRWRSWRAETLARLSAEDRTSIGVIFPAPPLHRGPQLSFVDAGEQRADIERSLASVRSLPAHDLRNDIVDVWSSAGPVPSAVMRLVSRRDLSHRITDLLWRYWEAAIGPYWNRMSEVIDDDVRARARTLAAHGVRQTVSELHPTVTASEEAVLVHKAYIRQTYPTGRLTLTPSVFAWPGVAFAPDSGNGRIGLMYAARGSSGVWDSLGAGEPSGALEALLGPTRASVLAALDEPRTTTHLAAQLTLSPATVSMHLKTLRRSSLAVARRDGRCVYYRRTALAEKLLAATRGAGGERSRRQA